MLYSKTYGKVQSAYPAQWLDKERAFGALTTACQDGSWHGSVSAALWVVRMVHWTGMARGVRLLDRPPDEIAVLLGNQVQGETARLISKLVTELRVLRTPGDYYKFQEELRAHVCAAQHRQAESSRNLKRERAGRTVPQPEAPTWELSLAIWDRTVRQLRSVGDAIAWRQFGYDRRYILALSRNQPSGPMVGKEGLDAEVAAARVAWERDGRFALLHDLTNSIRIGDMTIFDEQCPMVTEVKSSASGGSRHRAQVRRAQRAVAVLNDGAPLPGIHDTELLVSKQPFKTNLRQLQEELERARKDGISSRSIGHQQVVTALDVHGSDLPIDDLIQRSYELKRRAFTKAGLDNVQHHLRGVRADSIGRDATLAPFTIYPFHPDLIAALTTDLVSFEYVVGWDRLARAFERCDFEVELLLEPASGPVPEDIAILHDRRSDLQITIHNGILDQLLHELVDVDRYVAAVALESRRSDSDRRTHFVLTFSNERATWR